MCQEECAHCHPCGIRILKQKYIYNVYWHALEENIDSASIYLFPLADKNSKGLAIHIWKNNCFLFRFVIEQQNHNVFGKVNEVRKK